MRSQGDIHCATLTDWLTNPGRVAGVSRARRVAGAYEEAAEVMRAQADLVEPLATFRPRLVKMAPAGERPED